MNVASNLPLSLGSLSLAATQSFDMRGYGVDGTSITLADESHRVTVDTAAFAFGDPDSSGWSLRVIIEQTKGRWRSPHPLSVSDAEFAAVTCGAILAEAASQLREESHGASAVRAQSDWLTVLQLARHC